MLQQHRKLDRCDIEAGIALRHAFQQLAFKIERESRLFLRHNIDWCNCMSEVKYVTMRQKIPESLFGRWTIFLLP